MSETPVARPQRTGMERAIAVLAVPEKSVSPAQWVDIHSSVVSALRASDQVSFGTGGRIHVTLKGLRDLFTAAELMESLRNAVVAAVPQARGLSIGIAGWSRGTSENEARVEAERLAEVALSRGDGRIMTSPPLA